MMSPLVAAVETTGGGMTEGFAERRFQYEISLSPATTAVLVVDMLNDFLEDGGAMVLEAGRAVYEPIRRLVDAARRYDSPVIWVCDEHPYATVDAEFRKRVPHCIRGTWGAEIVDALDVHPGDYRVPKRRYSGFFQTDLDLRLRELGIESVVVTGVVTNICVRSTAHDAFFRGYSVVVPRDCVAATGPREQESTLFDIETHFGEVCSLDDVLALLGEGSAAGGTRARG
jgi:ureidoacrylate peracid hydrolase